MPQQCFNEGGLSPSAEQLPFAEILLLRRYVREAVEASLLGTLSDLEDPALLFGNQ